MALSKQNKADSIHFENITLHHESKSISIKLFDSQDDLESLTGQSINIIASGPSISALNFDSALLSKPTVFVNGSLSLVGEHEFTNVVGYVISDPRFIKNNPEILVDFYRGYPLYATQSVYQAMSTSLADIFFEYHSMMRVIFPVDRPLNSTFNNTRFRSIPLIKKIVNRKLSLNDFSTHPNFVINSDHNPEPIGVSLDITDGFVEAGTVAYVAAQLVFSRHAKTVHLYGIDLLNSNKPRFYENNKNHAPSKIDKAIFDRIVPSFNLMNEVYSRYGVDLINHSATSKDLFNF